MQLRPLIIDYPDSPVEITQAHRIAAAWITEDVTRIFNRITKRAMQFERDEALVLTAHFEIDPIVRDIAVRATSDSWWDAWRVLKRNSLSEFDDVWLVWHANSYRDQSGIAQPAAPHAFDGDGRAEETEPYDPAIGGIATNGFGQLHRAVEAGFEGPSYVYAMLYAAHEVGHAIGRHHTPDPETGLPNPHGENKMRSIMAYGYGVLAEGRIVDGVTFNPMLATPEEIVTWRQHAVFQEIPERQTSTEPGWADDLLLLRADDAGAAVAELETGQGRRRMLTGALRSDINDPIE